MAKKQLNYLNSVNRAYYAMHWPKLRYWHFKRDYLRFALEFLGIFPHNPIAATRHILHTGPATVTARGTDQKGFSVVRMMFVARALGNMAGGVERMVIAVMNEMVARGHDVALFSWDLADAEAFYPMAAEIAWFKLGMGDPMQKAGGGMLLKRLPRCATSYVSSRPTSSSASRAGRSWRCGLHLGHGHSGYCSRAHRTRHLRARQQFPPAIHRTAGVSARQS